eukprot:334116_1
MADENTENKIWNAYIDKHKQEPFNMGKLHNFAIGPNNPYDSVSFQIAAKIYRRNKGKGKIELKKQEKKQEKKHSSSILNSADIIELKKQNEELRKQVDALLASAGRKKNSVNEIKEEKKQEKKDNEPTEKNKYKYMSEYKLWTEIDKRIQQDDVDFIRQLLNDGIVDVNSTPSGGMKKSMLQLAASNGQYKIVQMLLNLGADVNYKYKFMKDSLTMAQKKGHYHVEKLLMLSKMDASASEQINNIATTLNKQSGYMYYMFKSAESKGNSDIVFGGLVDIMIDIINNRQAFSDDILNMAFDYSIKKALKSNHGGEGGENKENKQDKQDEIDRDVVISTTLWQCIYKTCADIITDKKHNKLDWYWLKTYLLSSSIWLRQFKDSRNNNELSSLYFELLNIVSGQASTQIDVYLKKPFKQIADENKTDWNELCTFDVDIKHKGAIRQDAIENGHKSQYTRDILGKKCVSIDPFNAFNHYDTRQYLSNLVLTAQMVNTQFQKDIVKIFDVNLKTLVGKYDCIYKEGPVKLLSRCQSKAQTDYKNEKFPVSAHVLDINRCSLIFDDLNSMLRGLKLFAQSVQNYKQNKICITQILRVKNGWKEYSHNNPSYADIKFNVVIKGEYHSIIGEVQFLEKRMMDFKNKQHPLYSISRKKEFITSMGDILPFLTDIPKTLNVNATMGNVNGICDAMVTQHLNVAQIVGKQYKNNIFDVVCMFGHVSAAKFLMEIMSDDMIIERLNTVNDWNQATCAEIVKTGNRQILKLIFEHNGFRNSIKDKGWIDIFNNMLRYCDFETSKIILIIGNVYKKISTIAWTAAISRSLSYGKRDYLALFINLCGDSKSKEIIISERLLQVALNTNWDEYRLEQTKYILNFGNYKKDIRDEDISDALYITVDKNDIDTFNMLCNDLIKVRNESVEKYLLMPHSDTKQTTLQCACKKGNSAEFIDILLSNMTTQNIAKYVNYKGGDATAIAYCAKLGETNIVDKLLSIVGIDVFGENEQKTSCAIIESLKRGNILIAEKLYSKLSDDKKHYQYDPKLLWDTVVNTAEKSDMRSLKFVMTNLLSNSTDLLINCDVKRGSLITIVTESNNFEKLKFMCSVMPQDKLGELINFQTEKGQNAIQVALDKGNMKMLKYFTTIAGVDFNLSDNNRNTPFRNAAFSSKFEIAELLFVQNKDENDKLHSLRYLNKSGNAAFIYVMKEELKFKLADIVLKNMDFKKLDLNILNDDEKYGENAVSWAARIGVMDIVNELLQIKGIMVTPDAILKAIEVDLYSTGELVIAEKLYNYLCNGKKKSFKYENEELYDILRKLCYSRDTDENKSIKMIEFVVNKLIDNKKDLLNILLMRKEANNLASEGILLTTMRHKKVELCKFIMSIISNDKVIDEIYFQDQWGNNILEYAAKGGYIDLFKYIISKYKNVNLVAVNSNNGDSTFHTAARGGYLDICELILSEANDNPQRLSIINLKNKKNETAVMVAKKKKKK